ncbi:Uncharacterised protein [Vibrio cholerae]|nr:Uncharacterised protein [Vibrio cholerae]CSI53663.1 Uncharacterised protein [Vibrio cholerae]
MNGLYVTTLNHLKPVLLPLSFSIFVNSLLPFSTTQIVKI